MNIVTLILLILCYSLVLGIIFAQVLLTAPVVFKVLDDQNASNFLRRIFPRYYLLLFLITLIALLISYLFFSIIDIYIALIAVSFSFLGYIIIPLTNIAKDRGWDSLFKGLHSLSVLNTVIIFLASIVEIVRVINQ
jgi:magnesium-transporting ATPase (P-type)